MVKHPDNFSWDDLRVLLHVGRAARFNAAGRRLKMDQTTIARRIGNLERALNLHLTERSNAGVVLTADGERLMRIAERMETLAERVIDQGSSGKPSVSGKVRIGAPDGFGNDFLAKHLPELRQEQPDLALEFVPVPLTHSLSKRDVDVAISLQRPESGRIMSRKLTDYQLRLYAGRVLAERLGLPQSRADLPRYDFVGYVEDLLYTEQLNFNPLIGSDLRLAYSSTTVKGQHEAIAAGVGLGVLPRFMADGDERLIPVLPAEIHFLRSYWVLVPEEIAKLARIRVVVDFIHQVTKSHTALFLPDGSR